MPLQVRAKGYKVSVERPMHIRRQGKSIARIIVTCFMKRVNVGGLNQRLATG